jgi:hypothetical protein
LEGAVAEAAQGALTCALTLVSMDGESFEAISLKEPDYLVASMFGAAEDKHLFGAFFEEYMREEWALVGFHDEH